MRGVVCGHLGDRPGVRKQRGSEQGDEQRDLVREDLRDRAHRAERGEHRTRRPPAEEERQRRDEKQIEDDDEIAVEREDGLASPERDVQDRRGGRGQREHRRKVEHPAVGLLRHDLFLAEQLQRVGHGRPALYDPYFITTEVEKIRSPSVLYRVIKDLGLATKWQQPIPMEPEEAFQHLSNMVDVRPVRDLNLFEIFVYSDAGKHTAEEGAEIANRIAESYRTNRAAWGNASRQLGIIKQLDQELERQDQAVREAQVRVDKLKQEYDMSDLSVEGATSALLEDAWVRRLKAEPTRRPRSTDH